MKKTQIIELFSNIKRTFITFLCIGMIGALGIGLYLGINFASQGLKDTNNKRYQEEKYRDFEAVSVFGFTQDDVKEVEKIPAVETAVGNYSVNGTADLGRQKAKVFITSQSEGVNEGILKSGHFPKQQTECAVEAEFAEKYSIEPGDTIVLEAKKGKKEYLNSAEYMVTGTMSYIGGNDKKGYILLPEEAFQKQTFSQCYTSIFIRMKGSENLPIYSEEYETLVDENMEEIQKIGAKRTGLRYERIKKDAEEEVTALQQELEHANQKLQETKTAIEDGQNQIKNAEQQIADGEEKLSKAESQIADGEKKLLVGAGEQKTAEAELETSYEMLVWANQQLKDTRESLDKEWEIVAQLEQRDLATDSDNQIIEELRVRLYVAEEAYTANNTQYNAKLQAYEEGRVRYENGAAEYQQKSAELEQAKNQYQNGQQQLQDAKQQVKTAKEELALKQEEYEAGKLEYGKQETIIAEAKEKVDNMETAQCILYPRSAVSSYVNIQINADNLAGLGLTFGLTFLIVAALVCYSSISRMVEEQRNLIGVQKAQGFFVSEIQTRYLLYAAISTLFGIVAGTGIAYFFIQRLILNIYKTLDNFDKMELTFLLSRTIIVALCVMAVTLIAARSACNHLLKAPATELMRDVTPTGKTHFWSRYVWWKKLSLFTRAIIGNMFLDKKRAVTVIIGMGGCTILLVIGFTLKMSARQAPQIQYDSILKYDSVLTVSGSMNEKNQKAVQEQLKMEGCEYTLVSTKVVTHIQGDSFNSILMVCAEEKELQGYIGIKDYATGQSLSMPAEGILLSQGTADAYGLCVGDVLVTMDHRGRKYELEIKGIFENYIGQKILISPSYYERIYGEKISQNQYYIHLNGTDETQLRENLFQIEGVKRLEPANVGQEEFDNLVGTLDSILVLFIVLSAIMAVMILLNIAMMHLRKKSRELAVMRVNGFTVREVKRYLQRENLVIASIGVAVGIIMGSVLSGQVQGMLNNQILQLKRGAQPLAWLIAAVIAMLFSTVINAIAMRKIKKLKLNNVDAN